MVMFFVKGLLIHDLKVLGSLDTNLVKSLTFDFKIIASHLVIFAPVLIIIKNRIIDSKILKNDWILIWLKL